MVNDDYTDKEDAVVDKEAIKFNNWDDNGDNDDNEGHNSGNDDNNNGDDYIEVVATTEKKRKKGKLSTSRKWHKSKGTAYTPINHDGSVMLSGEGDTDLREMLMPRILMTILICLRRRDMKKQKQKIGLSTKTDDQGGRFI